MDRTRCAADFEPARRQTGPIIREPLGAFTQIEYVGGTYGFTVWASAHCGESNLVTPMKFKHNLIVSTLLALMLLFTGCVSPKTGTPVPILSTDLSTPTMTPTQAPRTPTPALSSSQTMGIADILPITLDSAAQVELLRTLEDAQGRVWTLAFSADGIYFASADGDSLDIWDAASGQQLFELGIQESDLNSFAFSPDSRLVATGQTIWDVKSQQPIHRLDPLGLHPAFSPDATLLAVSGGRPIKIWDVASGQLLRTFESQTGDDSFNLVFSPDGKWLVDSGHDGRIRLWDVASGQVARRLAHGTGNDVHDFAFSPDGKWLVSVGTDYAVRLWDFASGQMLQTMTHSNGLYGVDFSPDGSLVASASCDRTVKLWDAASGKMLVSLRHGDEVTAVAFSPDGQLLVSADYLQKIYLWGIPR